MTETRMTETRMNETRMTDQESTPSAPERVEPTSAPELEMSLADKLRAELGVSTWQWLQPHDEREALFWVTNADLVEVAVAIAQDDATAVQGFLARGELKRAEGKALEGVAGYHVAIVQPFVLASPLPAPSA